MKPEIRTTMPWKNHVDGVINGTDTNISIDKIKLLMDSETAYALCNVLIDLNKIDAIKVAEKDQISKLEGVGLAIGKAIGHPSYYSKRDKQDQANGES